MNAQGQGRPALRAAGDLICGSLAFLAAFLLRIHVPLPFTLGLLPADRMAYFFSQWWIVAVSQLLLLYFFGLYDPPEPESRAELPRRLLAAVVVHSLLLMGFYFLTNREFPRSVLVLFAAIDFSGLLAWRSLLLRLHSPPPRRVIIVGSGPVARELASTVHHHPWYQLQVMGHVSAPDDGEVHPPEPDALPPEQILGPHLGTVDDLPALLAEGAADEVILATDAYPWQTRLIDRLAREAAGGGVLLLPGPFESLIGRMRYRWVRDLPMVEVVRQREWRVSSPMKRSFDILGATLLLLLALPAMAATALLVRLTSPGPVIYRQTRVGIHQEPFELLKFRTMHQDAEAATGEVLAQPNDPRLTPVGGFLRRTRLDELPQLFNVLGGSMSLVGPRPERPVFVRRYLEEVPGYAERFSIAPGLTGLAQINGHYHSTAQNKLRYDLAYIANWSLWLDFSTLLRTVKIVLSSQGT
ncbi:MAG: sugar transferase [Acidobacteriota bacterium]|nr:sugar transferase [Acidobacteriota bacterium]